MRKDKSEDMVVKVTVAETNSIFHTEGQITKILKMTKTILISGAPVKESMTIHLNARSQQTGFGNRDGRSPDLVIANTEVGQFINTVPGRESGRTISGITRPDEMTLFIKNTAINPLNTIKTSQRIIICLA